MCTPSKTNSPTQSPGTPTKELAANRLALEPSKSEELKLAELDMSAGLVSDITRVSQCPSLAYGTMSKRPGPITTPARKWPRIAYVESKSLIWPARAIG